MRRRFCLPRAGMTTKAFSVPRISSSTNHDAGSQGSRTGADRLAALPARNMNSARIVFLGPSLAQLDAKQQAKPVWSAPAREVKPSVRSGNTSAPRYTGKRKRAGREASRAAWMTGRSRSSRLQGSALASSVAGLTAALAGEPELGDVVRSRVEDKQHISEPEVGSNSKSFSEGVRGDERLDSVFNVEDMAPSFEDERDGQGGRPSVGMNSASKSGRLQLGPARVVGMRRIAFSKPLLLQFLERPRSRREGHRKDSSSSRLTPPPAAGSESRRAEEVSRGATTIESIPPPPTHAFVLAQITSISTLLSTPESYLSTFHGGSHFESAPKFNVLALVMRMSCVEDVPDWKAGGGRRMDRCNIVVKDASGCALKVVLEGDCATRWAMPREDTVLDANQLSISDMSSGQATLSDASSERYSNSLEASVSALHDHRSTSASRTTIERQRDDRLLPLRPGDVAVFSRLYLVRPRPLRRGRTSSSPSARMREAKATSTHAIASPTSGAVLELCWRNSIERSGDQRRNFDQCLTGFDARCKAIYRLAQAWSTSE